MKLSHPSGQSPNTFFGQNAISQVMDQSSSSSSTSIPKSESTAHGESSGTENRYQTELDYLENPTRDTLAEGIIGLLTPTIQHLDQGISQARSSQFELKSQLDQLETQLKSIDSALEKSADLEPYVVKLVETRKKVIVINSMLQDAQDRLNRVHQSCLKETSNRRTLLEQPK